MSEAGAFSRRRWRAPSALIAAFAALSMMAAACGQLPGVHQEFASGTGDRTGIFRDRIVIGIHAPVTGAAPVQAQAFESGKDLYWRWLERKGQSVFGRKVEVVFKDDTYS